MSEVLFKITYWSSVTAIVWYLVIGLDHINHGPIRRFIETQPKAPQ